MGLGKDLLLPGARSMLPEAAQRDDEGGGRSRQTGALIPCYKWMEAEM